MVKVQQPKFVASLTFAFFMLASLVDSLSTYAACGVPGLVEMNPHYDDPCQTFDWEILRITLASCILEAGVLFWVAMGKRPLCLAVHVVSFRVFLKSFWLTGTQDSSFSYFRIMFLWLSLAVAFSEASAAASNLLVLYSDFSSFSQSIGMMIEKFLLLVGYPNDVMSTYALGDAVETFLTMTLVGQWLTWKLLRLSLRFSSEPLEVGPK